MEAAKRAGRHAGGSGFRPLADDAGAHAVNGEVIGASIFVCLGDAPPTLSFASGGCVKVRKTIRLTRCASVRYLLAHRA